MMGRKKNKKKKRSIKNIYSDICSECMTKGILSPSEPCGHSMVKIQTFVMVLIWTCRFI